MADIGSTLREARMRARIDMSEVEAQTKIRAKYLRAIENEEWDLLPGPVYVKSFLRTYGDYLGLDSRGLVEEYKRQYERPTDHDVRPASSFHRERERAARGPLVPPWAVIGVVLIGIVAALYVIGSRNNKSKTPTAPTAQAGGSHRPHHRVRHRAAPPPSTTVTLDLVPTGSVYVCLVDGAGKMLIPGQIFSAGQTIPRKTAGKMLLTLGNNAVQMKVNGKPVTVAPSSTSIGYTLLPNGASPLPVAQQPRCA